MILAICNFIDHFNTLLGRCVSWLMAVMVAVVALIVFSRAFFAISSVALQESVTYIHGAAFMLALAYTLKEGGHVRVDVFYRCFNSLQKAWVNAIGTVLLLLPFSIFLLILSWQYAARSWEISEISSDAGGIAAVYALKSILPIAAALLVLQGFSEALRNLVQLTWQLVEPDSK